MTTCPIGSVFSPLPPFLRVMVSTRGEGLVHRVVDVLSEFFNSRLLAFEHFNHSCRARSHAVFDGLRLVRADLGEHFQDSFQAE